MSTRTELVAQIRAAKKITLTYNVHWIDVADLAYYKTYGDNETAGWNIYRQKRRGSGWIRVRGVADRRRREAVEEYIKMDAAKIVAQAGAEIGIHSVNWYD